MKSREESVKSRQIVIAWLYVVAWMIVIFAFSHQANSGAVTEEYLHDANIPVRKLAHVSEFAILFILSLRAMARSLPVAKTALSLDFYAFVLSFLYASSDEWHQSFVPGRSAKFEDVLVDMTGVIAAWLFVLALRACARAFKGEEGKANT